jgi:signal transduction histidine kinase
MRSIRRSMTVYLLVLLAATLAVVWVVIDQVIARALEAREAAGAELIENQYEEHCRNERERIDQALLQQAKDLGNIMQGHYATALSEEVVNYRVHFATAQLLFGPAPTPGLGPNFLTTLAWTGSGYTFGMPHRPNPVPGLLSQTYFANLPLPVEYIQHFDDLDGSADYFQVNTLAGREWHSKSMMGRSLPFDTKEISSKPVDPNKPAESANLIDWTIGYTTLGPDKQKVRRVLYQAPHYTVGSPFRGGRPGRGPGPGGFGPPPRSLLGSLGAWVNSGFWPPPPGFGPPGPNPTADSLPRLYIQCARPQSAIDAVLAKFAEERDQELGRLTAEIRTARRDLRAQIAGIGALAFLAVALGGPLLVGRGLRPVGKLSDAVSRVSEKDFKLPHDGSNLSVELVPIHARLTQTLDLLQRAFAREKQAVADISHELRTPIAALMATIDVALRKPRTSDQYRTALEECRLISKQLGQLVERIMTLASLDAGNDRTHIARTDGADLAVGCAAVIRPLAAANGVALDVSAEGPLELDTDAGKLREVLMNLLHNAVEYNRPDGVIELSAWRDGPTVVFEVRDTGIGMSQEVKEKIFERFYRADPSRHSTGIHAGLGLAIVKEYVGRLNGTIAVESTPGVGSAFRVTVPAPPATAPADRPADEPVTAGS